MNMKEILTRIGLFIVSIFVAIIIYETFVKWGVTNFILIKMSDQRGKIIMDFFKVGTVVLIYALLLLSVKLRVTKPAQTVLWIAYLGTIFLLLFARKTNYGGVNLDPFKIIDELHGMRAKIYFVGNILFFMPFGYLFRKLNFFIMLLVSLCMEFTIEMSQHITRRGMFDVCDIMINMTGIVAGYIIVHIIRVVLRSKERSRRRRRG
ncbi:VanZ family protein [uncultured Clostridium sp.]|uniref:VanZ family protein n=1 Tax=uncultured Clostridium sp. TaxID=59620 RepID=UPI00261C6223|nr:VanZ family protein [uncultured Clostridium sp.]